MNENIMRQCLIDGCMEIMCNIQYVIIEMTRASIDKR